MTKGAAIITGATGAVGSKIALALADDGYDIVIHYCFSEDNAIALQEQIESKGVRSHLIQRNFSSDEDYKEFIGEIQKIFPDCRLLINSASVFKQAPFSETTEAFFDEHMNANVKACFFLSQYFAKQFRQGNIINMLDTYMLKHKSPYYIYLLTKKTLHELTLMMAYDLAPDIRVNALALGIMDTVEEKEEYQVLISKKKETLPLRALPASDDVITALRHIIANKFYVGQCLYVDGGEHLL